jgi:hypothetical protein
MNGALCSGGCGIGEDVDHLMVGCVDVHGRMKYNYKLIRCSWSFSYCYYGTKELCTSSLFDKEADTWLQVIWLASFWYL